jgi:membrane protease YdiL (CAAX protease family)
MKNTPRNKIILFLILTVAFSAVFYYLVISAGSLQAQGGAYTLGLMWSPGVAAIITQLIFERSLRGMGWKLGRAKYLLTSYGLPLAYALAAYTVIWLTGLGKLDLATFGVQSASKFGMPVSSPVVSAFVAILIFATVGVFTSMFSALGEEIGWRGLLVPELAKTTTFTKTALISGGIWTLYHIPVLLFADYNNNGAPVWFGLICFAVLVIGISFAFAWLRLKSGSLWTGVVLHASHNLFIQGIFTPLTQNTGPTPYFIDEFGLGLALTAIVVAYIFWRKRMDLPQGN